MKVKVYQLRPFWNVDGWFIDRPGEPTFDPKHPSVYPGDEVRVTDEVTASEFIQKYGKDKAVSPDFLYCGRGKRYQILERTGRTSADIVEAAR